MDRSVIRAAGIAATLVPLAAAAPASAAPAVKAGNRCNRYIPAVAGKRYIPVGGTGFVPGDTTVLSYAGGDLAGYAPTNAGGAFSYRVFAPSRFISSKAIYKTYALGAHSQSNALVAAGTKVHMIRLTARTPSRARPTSRVTYKLYGFPNTKRVWAHYVFKHKRRATTYMGRASGTCGTLKKKQRYLPAKVHYGSWRVYFSNHKRFSTKNFILRGSFTVYRINKRAGAAATGGGLRIAFGPAARDALTP